MSTRFSEVANSRWCKTCNVQVLPGQEHPNLEAHLAETRDAEAAEARINAKMTATQTMIPVSSNDMMRHISLVSSPETLCGKIVVDRYRPSTTDRVCDTCAELSSGANFVKTEDETETSSDLRKASTVKEAINYTRDGLKIEDGFTVITSEEAEVLPFLDTNKVRVARYECPDCETKTHFERLASCEGCGEFKCVACMNTIGNFIGVCAKCAGVDGEISQETLDDPLDTDETFRLLSRLLTEEDEEADPLFLPKDEL